MSRENLIKIMAREHLRHVVDGFGLRRSFTSVSSGKTCFREECRSRLPSRTSFPSAQLLRRKSKVRKHHGRGRLGSMRFRSRRRSNRRRGFTLTRRSGKATSLCVGRDSSFSLCRTAIRSSRRSAAECARASTGTTTFSTLRHRFD